MREESHLDDMRAAIRGDFRRLEERRGAQGLMRVVEDVAEVGPAEPTPGEAAPEHVAPGSRLHRLLGSRRS